MEQFKIAKILMLATNNKSNIVLGKRNTLYNTKDIANVEFNNVLSPNNWIYQYLYFLSDEKIKKDDWYIDDSNSIRQAITSDEDYWERRKGDKKIIATNNPYLKIKEILDEEDVIYHFLPEPSQSFIEKYIEEYNKDNVITDVLVEYEYLLNDMGVIPYWCLKINPKDNTITIRKVKENYTKEELAQILEKFISFIWKEIGIHYPISLGKDAKDKFINSEL